MPCGSIVSHLSYIVALCYSDMIQTILVVFLLFRNAHLVNQNFMIYGVKGFSDIKKDYAIYFSIIHSMILLMIVINKFVIKARVTNGPLKIRCLRALKGYRF